jgi:hypothetical protein
MTNKGDQIRFVKGKYAGFQGWKDSSRKKKKGSRYRPVIIQLEGSEHMTSVHRASYRSPFQAPRSFEEAALQQHSDLELAMIRVADMFAELGVTDNRIAVNIFDKELKRAREDQLKLGSKARYRKVDFKAEKMECNDL